MAWRDLRIIKRLGLQAPLFQAPMAGAQASDLAIAVARCGGLGAIPCALLRPDAVREHVQHFRAETKEMSAPLNLNFFCHTLPPANPKVDKQWQDILTPYYREYGVDLALLTGEGALRMPFDNVSLQLVQEIKPEVVSFHFGLPSPQLLQNVKETGAFVISTATTVREALWLEERGCDAVIAQGIEAGGHRGVFLPKENESSFLAANEYRNSSMNFPQQIGTMSLVPQIVDALKIPVIAAGGIGDARGILAASALGAAAVQMGMVFLLADETKTSTLHRKLLKRAAKAATHEETAITNIFSGRPARGFVTRVMQELGPMSEAAPEFPTAGTPLGALKKVAEARDDTAFSSLWSGQSPCFAQEKSAKIIVHSLIQELEDLVTKTSSPHSFL